METERRRNTLAIWEFEKLQSTHDGIQATLVNGFNIL